MPASLRTTGLPIAGASFAELLRIDIDFLSVA